MYATVFTYTSMCAYVCIYCIYAIVFVYTYLPLCTQCVHVCVHARMIKGFYSPRTIKLLLLLLLDDKL